MKSPRENVLDIHIKFMQATAMWPMDFNNFYSSRLISSLLERFFQFIVLFISLHIAILHAVTSVNTIGGDLDDLSDFFTLTIIYSFTFFIVCFFILRRRKCKILFDFLNDNFRWRSTPGLTYITSDLSYKATKRNILIWIPLCLTGVTFWALYPVMVNVRAVPLRCKYPYDVLNFLDTQIKFMQVPAMWPCNFKRIVPKRLSRFAPIADILFKAFVLFISLHIAVLHMKTSVDNIDSSLDDLSDLLTLTIIYSFTFFIVCYFIVRRKNLTTIVEFLNENFRHRSSPGLTYITVDTSYRTVRFLNTTWIILCIVGVIFWAAYPIFVQRRILPLRCQYPFDHLKPIIYEITYFIQFLGQIEVGLAFGMVSGLYMSLIMLICGQFDILFCSFKNVFYTAHLLSDRREELKSEQSKFDAEMEECGQYFFNVTEHLENIDEAVATARNKFKNYIPPGPQNVAMKRELQASLKECIKHHEIILKLCAMMEEFYNPFCFIKSLQVTFQFCFLAFVFVNTTSSTIRTVNLAQYLFLTLAEFLMFTYYGEVLQQQSMRVSDALLRSPWHLFSKELRREILIILPNTLKPVRLTGGRFFNMDVERFRLVVGTGFSYFTLLQNMQS